MSAPSGVSLARTAVRRYALNAQPKSEMSTMWGLPMLDAALASRTKRPTDSLSLASSAWRILMATLRLRSMSMAPVIPLPSPWNASGWSTGPGERITARSTAFSSSRTLPGQ